MAHELFKIGRGAIEVFGGAGGLLCLVRSLMVTVTSVTRWAITSMGVACRDVVVAICSMIVEKFSTPLHDLVQYPGCLVGHGHAVIDVADAALHGRPWPLAAWPESW